MAIKSKEVRVCDFCEGYRWVGQCSRCHKDICIEHQNQATITATGVEKNEPHILCPTCLEDARAWMVGKTRVVHI